jgi:hypothetical protein
MEMLYFHGELTALDTRYEKYFGIRRNHLRVNHFVDDAIDGQ